MSEEENMAADQPAENEAQAAADAITEDDWAAAMAEQEAVEPTPAAAPAAPEAKPANIFQSFSPAGGEGGMMHELDMILDIPVQLTVELGRTKITIRNLLQLAHGTVG